MGELNRVSSGVRHQGSTSSLSSAASTSPPASPRHPEQANGGSPSGAPNGAANNNGNSTMSSAGGAAAVPSSEQQPKLRHVPSMSTLYTEGENYRARPSRCVRFLGVGMVGPWRDLTWTLLDCIKT